MRLFVNPKNPTPHPYQNEVHDSVLKSWRSHRAVLVALPTGGGKTFCANRLIKAHLDSRGKRCLVLAHTRKLVSQFAAASESDFGLHVSIESGTSRCDDSPVVCGTIQSISRRIQTDKRFHPESFDRIIIDEAHRALSPGYKAVDAHFKNAKILGITATPRRTDQKDLMQFFDAKAIDIPIQRLIKEGYLAPIKIENFPIKIEVKKEKKTGDFSEKDVAHAIEPYLSSCADELAKRIGNRCGLVFLPLVATSISFCEMLRARGVRAAHISGDTSQSEQAEIERGLSLGTYQVVCNSMLWTEGVDIKMVSLILNLRLTESWVLYTQICGRGTRTFDPNKDGPRGGKTWAELGSIWKKKDDLLLLDPLWLCEKHSLIQRPACLLARDDEDLERMDAIIKAGGGKADLMEASESAKASRESALQERLAEMAKRKSRLINAMELFDALGRPDLVDYEAKTKAEMRGISPNQMERLVKSGIDLGTVVNTGHADEILNAIIARQREGKPSLAQCKYAKQLGMVNAWNSSPKEVADFISRSKLAKEAFSSGLMGRNGLLPVQQNISNDYPD